MSTIEQYIFGTLGTEYCQYFYYLSIFNFSLMIMTIVSYLWIGIAKKLDTRHYIQMFFLALVYFIFYFQNRLLYTICVK